jgi:hypothetical protein
VVTSAVGGGAPGGTVVVTKTQAAATGAIAPTRKFDNIATDTPNAG